MDAPSDRREFRHQFDNLMNGIFTNVNVLGLVNSFSVGRESIEVFLWRQGIADWVEVAQFKR